MQVPLAPTLVLVAIFNLVAFAAQGIDKSRARRGAWRIPESTLLALGLPLAAPGMLLGMRVFAHKTRKLGFVARAAAVAAVNLGLALACGWAVRAGWITPVWPL